MDLAEFAKAHGLSRGCIGRYFHDKRLPEPDSVTGSGPKRRYGWLPETVHTWREENTEYDGGLVF